MGVVWGSCNTTPQHSPPRAGTALRMSSVSGHPWPEGTPSPHGVPHRGCRMGARRGCSQAGGCGHSPAPAPPSAQLLHLTSLTSATGKEKVEAAGAEVLPCTFWGAAHSPLLPALGGVGCPTASGGTAWCHHLSPPRAPRAGAGVTSCPVPPPGLAFIPMPQGTWAQLGDKIPVWGHDPSSRDKIPVRGHGPSLGTPSHLQGHDPSPSPPCSHFSSSPLTATSDLPEGFPKFIPIPSLCPQPPPQPPQPSGPGEDPSDPSPSSSAAPRGPAAGAATCRLSPKPPAPGDTGLGEVTLGSQDGTQGSCHGCPVSWENWGWGR